MIFTNFAVIYTTESIISEAIVNIQNRKQYVTEALILRP